MPLDASQLSPAVLQQLAVQQQGAAGGDNTTAILQQLAQDPQAMAAALQQMGIQVTAEQLMQVAENWIDGAASKAANGGKDVEAAAAEDEGGEEVDAEAPAPAPSVPRGAAPPTPAGGGAPAGMTTEDMISMALDAEDVPTRGTVSMKRGAPRGRASAR